MTPASDAAVCLLALAVFRRLGLAAGVSACEVLRRLGVARSYAYEQRDRLTALRERGEEERGCGACRDAAQEARLLTIANSVLRYVRDHPGAWEGGKRNVYSAGLRAFVLQLGDEHGIGRDLEQADFAVACEIPLPTLKAWWTERAARPPLSAEAPEPPAEPQQHAAPPDDAALAGFTLEMLRIIRDYESWNGTLEAFVAHLRDDLRLHYGRERVTQLLHLAAARKLSRKPPPPPPVRGATFRPPPGVQWTSDGKEVELVVGEQTFVVTWQPMVDVG